MAVYILQKGDGSQLEVEATTPADVTILNMEQKVDEERLATFRKEWDLLASAEKPWNGMGCPPVRRIEMMLFISGSSELVLIECRHRIQGEQHSPKWGRSEKDGYWY